VPVLRYSFGIVNCHQEELKTKSENEESTKHSWTSSHKDRCRSLVCSQKTERKGLNAVRSSPCSRNKKLVKNVGRKKDPLNSILRTNLQILNQILHVTSPKNFLVPLIKTIQFQIKCFM
jgi:hypothetical protein